MDDVTEKLSKVEINDGKEAARKNTPDEQRGGEQAQTQSPPPSSSPPHENNSGKKEGEQTLKQPPPPASPPTPTEPAKETKKKSPNGVPLTLEGVAKAIKDGKISNIVVMTGAGISVSAGIPDFRTPGTGLYDNLQKYNLPSPEDMFNIEFFRVNPKPFCELAKGLYPGLYKPTPTHCFIRLLAEKKVLLRNFTQNIDTLEFGAKIPKDKVVQAHGGFSSARCIKCGLSYSPEFVRKEIFADKVPRCSKCSGLVKPDIVFFGESLPKRFHRLSAEDMPKCDLLLVLGTSLQVHPFAGLVDEVDKECVRILFNREPVGQARAMSGLPDKEQLKELASSGDMRAHFLLQMIERQEAEGFRFG
mmetsp:Transcript_24553/g.39406  ORF Transcript_24553/g.39406 Transcript_24553/m.39406 type:complete len:360 (-) Transcript_24553:125-1204(-)